MVQNGNFECFTCVLHRFRRQYYPQIKFQEKSIFVIFDFFDCGFGHFDLRNFYQKVNSGSTNHFFTNYHQKTSPEKNVPLNSTYFRKLTTFCDFSHFPQNPTIPHFHLQVSVEYSTVVEMSIIEKYEASAFQHTFNHGPSPPRTSYILVRILKVPLLATFGRRFHM